MRNDKNFILSEVPKLHPSSNAYVEFWKEQKKRCVEGYWSAGRWMPGNLYFYTNFWYILLNKNTHSKTKSLGKPFLRDLEWEFFYGWIEARGFSGFKYDKEFTAEFKYKDFPHPEGLKYVTPRELLHKFRSGDLGGPLFNNEAKNFMMLGSRGFGKSYSVAGGIVAHEWLFDGLKEYNPDSIDDLPSTEVVVGAGDAKYSSDILQKVILGIDNLEGGMEIGDKYYPPPFSKKYMGSWTPGKEVRANYKKKIGGSWHDRGSTSKIKHRTFRDNPFAANGTRPAVMVMEEIGMFNNLKLSHESSVECMKNGAYKFGSCMYLGTGGDMEGGGTIDARDMFYDPHTYDLVTFNDVWEDKGSIAYFVPAYKGLNQFKDKKGETLELEAKKYLTDFRDNLRKGKNSRQALDAELQNRPLVPSEVFLTRSGNIFPVGDLQARLSELEGSNKETNLDYIGDLKIDSDTGDIVWKPNPDLTPITDFPLKVDSDEKGCVVIYEMPYLDENDDTPFGMYLSGMDPYDHDKATTTSLGSMFVYNKVTNRVVAEFTGRPETANEYYETARRLLKFYNSRCLYENERKGFFQYLEYKNETYRLLDTPSIIKDIIEHSKVQRGKGMHMTKGLKDYGEELVKMWLLEVYDEDKGMLNLHKLRSIPLLKELISYNDTGNFDRVISFIMVMYHNQEMKKQRVDQTNSITTILDSEFWSRDLFKNRGKLQF